MCNRVLQYYLLVQPFEVASLPLGLGLAEDGNSLSRSPLSLRQRSDAERAFLSSHRPLTSLRPSSVAVISDIPDFSSTTDLTPLSVVTFKEEKSQRNIWLDNASLMVGTTIITTVIIYSYLICVFNFQGMSLALCNIWRLPTFIYFNHSGKKIACAVFHDLIIGLGYRRSFNCLYHSNGCCWITVICVGVIFGPVWTDWSH